MLHQSKFAYLLLISLLVSGCQSSREIKNTPSEEEAHYQPIHISASKTITSDTKHANYSDKKVATQPDKTPPVTKERVIKEERSETPKIKKSIPIVRETPSSYNTAPSVNYQIANILFANGSSVIDSSYNAQIAKIARLAKQHNAQIRVYGFSSSRTRNTDAATHKMINFKTSLQRANSVAAALRRAGVNKNNITVEALSDSRPLFSEAMPEGERLNRRAEVYIAY